MLSRLFQVEIIEQLLFQVEFLGTYAETCLYADNHFYKVSNIYKPNKNS